MNPSFRETARAVLARTDLTAGAKVLLLTLLDRQGGNPDCYPSFERMQADTGQTRNAVRRALAELTGGGFVRVVKARSLGRAHRGRYRVVLPLPARKGGDSNPLVGTGKGCDSDRKRVRFGYRKGCDSHTPTTPEIDVTLDVSDGSAAPRKPEDVIEEVKEDVITANQQVSLALSPNEKPRYLTGAPGRIGRPVPIAEAMAGTLKTLGLKGR